MSRILGCLPLAGMIFAAAAAQAQNERLLFDNPGYSVAVAGDFYCDEPAGITVRSGRPELFETDSAEMQRIVDATQAVLGFECPDFGSVSIEGRLAGLGEPVYAGIAERRENWELATQQSIQSEEYENYQAPLGDGSGHRSADGSGFTVASLTLGMSVDETLTAISDTFGVDPEYDTGEGVLTMQAGGCPADYDWSALSLDPQPGWKCLQAWFTDQRLARLYLLDLVQVVEAQEPEAVAQHLVERFGEPAYRDARERDSGWWKKDDTMHVLAWGGVVETADTGGGEKQDVYRLQAKVLPVDGATVVTVTLYDPGLRPRQATGAGSEPSSRVPDLTL